jgi:hypothetical protein
MMQRWAKFGFKGPSRTHLGITPYLAYWLAQAGFHDVRYSIHTVDISAYNHAMHLAFCEQAMIFMQMIQPLLLFRTKVIEEGAYAELKQEIERQMADLRFCGIVFGVTCSGTKPQ